MFIRISGAFLKPPDVKKLAQVVFENKIVNLMRIMASGSIGTGWQCINCEEKQQESASHHNP